MSRTLRTILGFVIVGAITVWAGVWIHRHWGDVSRAFLLNPWWLASLAPLAVGFLLMNGWVTQMMASHLGAPLPFRQWAALSFSSTLANYQLPLGGPMLRAGFYKHFAGFSLAGFAGALAVALVINVLIKAAMVLGAVVWMPLPEEPSGTWQLIVIVALAAGVGCSVVMVLAPRATERTVRWRVLDFVLRVHAGWDVLRKDPGLLARAAAVTLGASAVYALRLWIAFEATGHPIDAAECVFIGGVAGLTLFISVTPGSLGVREGAVVFAGYALGIPGECSLLAGVADRVVAMLVVVTLGALSSMYLARAEREIDRGAAAVSKQ